MFWFVWSGESNRLGRVADVPRPHLATGASADPTIVSDLLDRTSAGDEAALDELMDIVYGELRRLASVQLGRIGRSPTLGTTALVHETYIKLLGANSQKRTRAQFFALAAKAMRSVLIDQARRRNAGKRGGGRWRVSLDKAIIESTDRGVDLLALDDALTKLESVYPRAAGLVELRFFGGRSNAETAETLGISERTVEREWKVAQAWLKRELGASVDGDEQ